MSRQNYYKRRRQRQSHYVDETFILALVRCRWPGGGSGVIHHSDRGSQYCSAAYVGRLKRGGFRISMTESNHCYENSQAERLNGILKDEYGLGGRFLSKSDALIVVHEAVKLYNYRRPHQALGYRCPMTVQAKHQKETETKVTTFDQDLTLDSRLRGNDRWCGGYDRWGAGNDRWDAGNGSPHIRDETPDCCALPTVLV